MVFTSDHSTSLYSRAWTPSSTGTYAATCIFLIALAIISRLLYAYRHLLETRWHERALNSRYIVALGSQMRAAGEAREKRLDSSSDGEEDVNGVRDANASIPVAPAMRPRGAVRNPWRFSTDLPRACIFTVQAGVGYLL